MNSDGNTSTYRAMVDITFTEVGGVGVRIDKFTETTTKTLQTAEGIMSLGIAATSDVFHQIPPGGSVTQPRALQFGASAGETVTWSVQVAGADSQGRPFVAASSVAVVLVVPDASKGN